MGKKREKENALLRFRFNFFSKKKKKKKLKVISLASVVQCARFQMKRLIDRNSRLNRTRPFDKP